MLANEMKMRDLNKIIIYGNRTAESYLIHINNRRGKNFKSCSFMS